ncbi:unnamed protein product, partial [Symbiodinium pilosum]
AAIRAKEKEGQKAARERYIQVFRDVHGPLTGALVCAFKGWRGEAKHLKACDQYAASYYDTEGRCWKLLKDLEAHFGKLLEEGKENDLPDIAAAKEAIATDENGRVINIARTQNKVEDWTQSQARDPNKPVVPL